MAVVRCKIMDDHRASEDENAVRFIELYRVITDSDTDTPATILEDPNEDIPRVGDPHPVNTQTTVKSRRVTFTGARNVYTLEVSYDNAADTNQPGGGGGGGGQIDVLQVTLTNWWEDYIQEYAYDGRERKQRMANSSGDPIKYEARRPHPMITISSVTKDPFLANIVGSVGSVNSDRVSWLGLDFLPEQLLFDSYDATSSGNKTWRETFVFKAKLVHEPDEYGDDIFDGRGRAAGWQPFILDAGLWEWAVENGELKRRPIYPIDKDGGKPASRPVTEPWPLDGNAKAIPRDKIKQDRVYNKWNVYPKMLFKAFKFDFTVLLTEEKQRLG
jgi:hypothetical protein